MTDELLYPYTVLGSTPRLTVSNPRLDGHLNGDVLPREALVDLHSIEGPWKRVRLRAHLQVPAERLARMTDEHTVVCTVHCPSTNLRHAVMMEADPGRAGSYSAEVELERLLLHQRARVEAVVAGTVEGVEDRYLARSNSIDVQISSVRIPEITGDLEIAWRPFDKEIEGLPPLDPALHDQLSWVELDRPEGPRLWLNSSVTGLPRLLDERPGRPELEAAVRETVFDGIATSATMAMFGAALAAATELVDEDGPPWPGEWQGDVLRSLLPLMYPEREVDDALQHVVETQDGAGGKDIHMRAHAAVAKLLKTNSNAKRAIKALEKQESNS